jgi:serine protease Do
MRRILVAFTCLLVVVSNSVKAELPDFKLLVKQAAPAVVNISTIQKVQESSSPYDLNYQGPNGEEIPEIFRHFFQIPDENTDDGVERRVPQSLGSGFIISTDGYILTNHHVVKGADQVIVRLNDRRELEADVVGSDERSDVALLKIDADSLPTVKIGDSSKLEQGEWVLAIGSPFGFDHTVTSGIVSATGRSLSNETYVPFIQTDVAINPGNSGGPLFNLNGEVVGINSQIYTRSGGFMGLSFAIPMDVAMNVANQLKESGFVTRGWLGVIIQEVNKDLAESFGLEKPSGALVAKVLADSPAAKAGLLEGDIITGFNGDEVNLSSDLPYLVGRVKPGVEAVVTVIRNGAEQNIPVTIGALPEDPRQAKAADQASEAPHNNRLNIVFSDLATDELDDMGVNYGIFVQKVLAGPAAEAGLMSGDVITMLNGERVENAAQFTKLVESLPVNRAVPMRIVRRGSPIFIPLKLSQ